MEELFNNIDDFVREYGYQPKTVFLHTVTANMIQGRVVLINDMFMEEHPVYLIGGLRLIVDDSVKDYTMQ